MYCALLRLRRLAQEAASANPFTRALVPKQAAAARRDLAAGLVAMRGYGDGHALPSADEHGSARGRPERPRRRCSVGLGLG